MVFSAIKCVQAFHRALDATFDTRYKCSFNIYFSSYTCYASVQISCFLHDCLIYKNFMDLRSGLYFEFCTLPKIQLSERPSLNSGFKGSRTCENDGQPAAYTTLHIINHIRIIWEGRQEGEH